MFSQFPESKNPKLYTQKSNERQKTTTQGLQEELLEDKRASNKQNKHWSVASFSLCTILLVKKNKKQTNCEIAR